MNHFADLMIQQCWIDVKELFEFWVRSLDENGKPNKFDVNLYNHYLRANLMIGASAGDLLDFVAQMDDFELVPNLASFNLILKAMRQAKETEAAEKLLDAMDTSKTGVQKLDSASAKLRHQRWHYSIIYQLQSS
ncbi:hypothetical protein ES319_D12G183300v1 [Gossypium barbadense]|uniref:Pentacotripeptide-repeat region of PRORP domain-containing protein n=1 Tax=Gossypium barbadense TaxID=3634 RepID=A0A5J5NZS7_GOSBA|nr:hypothetical protein ES319_D12G183300v1 [Gossypium barbadense]